MHCGPVDGSWKYSLFDLVFYVSEKGLFTMVYHHNVFNLVSLFKYTGVLIVTQANYGCGLFCLKKVVVTLLLFSFLFGLTTKNP